MGKVPSNNWTQQIKNIGLWALIETVRMHIISLILNKVFCNQNCILNVSMPKILYMCRQTSEYTRYNLLWE